MKINKASHKTFLFNEFYPNGQEQSFPLTELTAAASAVKKIRDSAEEIKNDKGEITNLKWDNAELEFTLDEANIFKGLISKRTSATISQSEVITELKELLK